MSRTVLVVDDSSTIRRVVELTLGDAGYRVETAGGGHEGLESFERVRPDIVLADAVMPDPSGFEVCRAVKRSPRPVPVLLLAGTFESFAPDQAQACGADGHLRKPFDSDVLLERVRALLECEPTGPAAPATGLSSEQLDEICAEVVRRISERTVREVARELVPRIAERVVRERIRDLERGDP